MWTDENRPRYNRDKLRYLRDLTDEKWAHIEPLIPPGKPGGGKRPALPKDLPHLETEIIKRSNRVKGFVVQPRRWMVERTIPGSTAAPDWPRTGKTSTVTRSPSSGSPQSASCSENSVILHKVSRRTAPHLLDRRAGDRHIHRARRSDGCLSHMGNLRREESPGSTETRCRVPPGGGDPRESATESKPPFDATGHTRRAEG